MFNIWTSLFPQEVQHNFSFMTLQLSTNRPNPGTSTKDSILSLPQEAQHSASMTPQVLTNRLDTWCVCMCVRKFATRVFCYSFYASLLLEIWICSLAPIFNDIQNKLAASTHTHTHKTLAHAHTQRTPLAWSQALPLSSTKKSNKHAHTHTHTHTQTHLHTSSAHRLHGHKHFPLALVKKATSTHTHTHTHTQTHLHTISAHRPHGHKHFPLALVKKATSTHTHTHTQTHLHKH